MIRYSIDGEGSDVFEIGSVDGMIRVKANEVGRSNLDREKQSQFTLKVCKVLLLKFENNSYIHFKKILLDHY